MQNISVSIVFATAQQQWLEEFQVPRGTSVGELVEQSDYFNKIEALQSQSIDNTEFGTFGQKCDLDDLLEEGDRVEIYRPLTADPKEVRRQLALLGKSMGKGSK